MWSYLVWICLSISIGCKPLHENEQANSKQFLIPGNQENDSGFTESNDERSKSEENAKSQEDPDDKQDPIEEDYDEEEDDEAPDESDEKENVMQSNNIESKGNEKKEEDGISSLIKGNDKSNNIDLKDSDKSVESEGASDKNNESLSDEDDEEDSPEIVTQDYHEDGNAITVPSDPKSETIVHEATNCCNDISLSKHHEHQHDHYHHEGSQTITCLHHHHHHHHHHHQHHHFHYQPYCCECGDKNTDKRNPNDELNQNITANATTNLFADIEKPSRINETTMPIGNVSSNDSITSRSENPSITQNDNDAMTNNKNVSKYIFQSVARICDFLHNKSNAYKVVHDNDKRCRICKHENHNGSKRSSQGNFLSRSLKKQQRQIDTGCCSKAQNDNDKVKSFKQNNNEIHDCGGKKRSRRLCKKSKTEKSSLVEIRKSKR